MFGSSFRSESWIDPPAILGDKLSGSATTDLSVPVGGSRREREFAAGRRCAANALRRAGASDLVVGVGRHRMPIWPQGFVGSITHTATFAWAAAGSTTVVRAIGIDAEPIFDASALTEVMPLALGPREIELARQGHEAERATLVFSAKESVFKCLNPCVGEFFEFADVQCDRIEPVDASHGTFELRLLRTLAEFPCGARLTGQYAIARDHVHTAVELRQ